MGRWVYREGKKGPISSYFRSYFFAGFLFNFIGLIACMSVKYYDEEITKAKWKGAFIGFSFSVLGFVWTIIGTTYFNNNVLVIVISIFMVLASILFGILYKYGGQEKDETPTATSTPTKSISPQEMKLWVEAYLCNVGMNAAAISVAVSDGKLSKSYNLIRRKPSMSKEDFLIEMEMYEFL